MASNSPVLDVATVLRSLAATRRVFHSEADLQFAFAWTAKSLDPRLEVRLETHPEPNVRLDLQITDPSSGAGLAIELKYMSRLWVGVDAAEAYALTNHGARDLRCYDVVKDIERVERFVEARAGWTGYVIALTNEPSYWRPPTHRRATNADAFRLYEGAVLHGDRAWGPYVGGTARGREAPIRLRDAYHLAWSDYSRIDGTPAGTFRVLVIPVGAEPSKSPTRSESPDVEGLPRV